MLEEEEELASRRRGREEDTEEEEGLRGKTQRVDDKEESEDKEAEEDDEGDVIMALRKVSQKIEEDLMEMYSPPRVTEEAKEWGRKPGEAMDLTTGWDFRKEEDRKRAWE